MDISSSPPGDRAHLNSYPFRSPLRDERPQRTATRWVTRRSFVRLLLLLSLLLPLLMVTACNTGPAREANGVKWLTNEEAGPMPEDTICLVSGEPSKTGFAVSYKGKTYFLCCKKCIRAFQAEPDRYAEDGAAPEEHEHGP